MRTCCDVTVTWRHLAAHQPHQRIPVPSDESRGEQGLRVEKKRLFVRHHIMLLASKLTASRVPSRLCIRNP